MSTDFHTRSLLFTVGIARLVDAIPRKVSGIVISDQIMCSAAAVGAHMVEARRARTKADTISSLGVALQEADKTAYWLELISAIGLVETRRLTALRSEINELQAILSVAITSARRGKRSV